MRGEDDSTTRAAPLQGPANVDNNNTTSFAFTATTTTTTTATPAVVVAAATAAVGGAVGAHLPVLATGGEADSRTVIIPSAAAGGSNVNHSAGKAGVLQSGAGGGSGGSVNGTNSTTSTATSNMEQAEEFVKPIFKDGEIILEVECGQNKAAMYLSKLCQGSKGPCISFQGSWLTPNEFQFVSGRETAKDWKRSIRHHGKSLKLLLAKGILSVHPTMCDCEGCRIGAVLTRKGEKRRIPNGERKRKSTGNAPENSGSGAFRAVGNLAKTQDSIVLDPKRVVVEKFVEGSQSPLKESSLLNLPEMKSDTSICLAAPSVVSDASKALPDVGLNTPSLPSAAPPERLADINGNTPPASIGCSKDSVESASRLVASDKQKTNEGQRHSNSSSTNSSSSNSTDTTTSAQNSGDAADSAGVAATSDVRVLSSSGGATVMSVDKSLSRLALHQAAAATMKTPEEANSEKAAAGPLPPSAAKTDIVNKEERLSGEPRSEKLSDSASKTISRKETKEGLGSGEATMKLDKSASSLPPAGAVVGDREPSSEPKEKDNEIKVAKIAAERSAGLHRPRDQCSSKTTPPVSTASTSTSTSTATVTTHKSTQSRDSGRDETKHRHNPSSTLSSSSFSSSAVTSATLPEAVRPSEKGEHYTMKHSTGEHRSDEKFAQHKHAAGKSADHHHHHHHHHHVASSDKKERRAEVASGTAPEKDRHMSRDKESSSSSSSSSRHGDRESERRKHEDKVLEKERGRLATSGGGSGKSAFSAEKHDPIPAQEFPAGALVRSDGSAEAAAFSDYMRVLAAGHHGLMPPPTACLPPIFPVRGPDVSVSTGLLHPMHACSMFSTPGGLLPKDSVMYPTSAGALSAQYVTPSVTPLHVMPPHQFPTAAATSVLDYSRSYPYPLPWASGLPLIVPDAMSAAAAAAAAANSAGAAAAAKRSRDEVDSAVDLSSKRLRLDQQLSAAGYGPALSMAPMDYMATFRGLPSMSCGMESNLYDKSAADYMRKRLYPEMPTASASGSLKGLDSHYLSSLPDYYRALYCCGCMENRPEDVRTWSVEDVVKFVSALDGCSVYAEIFREQRVDGKILVLLTTDHLMKSLGMKLGPAILLTQRVAKILQEATRASGCDMCKRLASMVPALHSVGY